MPTGATGSIGTDHAADSDDRAAADDPPEADDSPRPASASASVVARLLIVELR
ncbi:MAG: hypothetical protein H0V92_11115 [Pseudonocardiales bacterium]|nr:hypothetical protein [Pseudonocardiales bacterium]